jgi:hypothetical protein
VDFFDFGHSVSVLCETGYKTQLAYKICIEAAKCQHVRKVEEGIKLI